MAKFKSQVAIRSGQYPPCILYRVLFTVPKEHRVNRANLTSALRGEGLELLFNCPIMEAVCEHYTNMCMCLLYLCIHACMRVLVNVNVHIVHNYVFACVCRLYRLQQPLPVSDITLYLYHLPQVLYY